MALNVTISSVATSPGPMATSTPSLLDLLSNFIKSMAPNSSCPRMVAVVIIGSSHDIGAATLLTAGCYVFGVVPSCYPNAAKKVSRYLDVPTQLLDTAIFTKTTAFAGVPWVLEGFMIALKNEACIMGVRLPQ